MRPCSTCFHLSRPHIVSFIPCTETAVLSVHNDIVYRQDNDIVRAVDNRELSLLVLLDLSAAFDTVDHHILLNILENRFCLQDVALDWFRSYLTGRTQPFVLGDTTTGAYTHSTARYHRDPYSVHSASSLMTSVTSSSVSTACL